VPGDDRFGIDSTNRAPQFVAPAVRKQDVHVVIAPDLQMRRETARRPVFPQSHAIRPYKSVLDG
jgi:hypothetical protein